MLTCLQCQEFFIPGRTNTKKVQKYCSKKCAGLISRTRIKNLCKNCNTETLNAKFCSHACSASFVNAIRPKRAKTLYCTTCGNPSGRNKYCSTACNPARPVLTAELIKFRKARKNEAWQRYMAKRKNQTPADADIPAMQLFYANCPEGYEVDHIIPISRGGLHTLPNLQYLTIADNRKKSNKVDGRS